MDRVSISGSFRGYSLATSVLSSRLKIFPVFPGATSAPQAQPTDINWSSHKKSPHQETCQCYTRSVNVFNPIAFQKLNSQNFWRGSARKSFVEGLGGLQKAPFSGKPPKKAQSHPNTASPAASFPGAELPLGAIPAGQR